MFNYKCVVVLIMILLKIVVYMEIYCEFRLLSYNYLLITIRMRFKG